MTIYQIKGINSQKNMPGRIKDITGKKFSRITVLKFDHLDLHHCAYWKCKCKCGIEFVVRGDSLKNKDTRSCGCLMKEIVSKIGKKTGGLNKKKIMKNLLAKKMSQEVLNFDLTCDSGCLILNEYLYNILIIWGKMCQRV
jgi:hypothetical protein